MTLKFKDYSFKLLKKATLFFFNTKKKFTLGFKNQIAVVESVLSNHCELIKSCLTHHNFIGVSVVLIPVSTVRVRHLRVFLR